LETWSKIAAPQRFATVFASGKYCTLVPILILSVRAAIAAYEDQRAGGEGRAFGEMQFCEPHHVQAVFLAGVDDVEPGGESIRPGSRPGSTGNS